MTLSHEKAREFLHKRVLKREELLAKHGNEILLYSPFLALPPNVEVARVNVNLPVVLTQNLRALVPRRGLLQPAIAHFLLSLSHDISEAGLLHYEDQETINTYLTLLHDRVSTTSR